jgi:predicted nucleotidyltransferase
MVRSSARRWTLPRVVEVRALCCYNGTMAKNRLAPLSYVQPYRYRSPNIPLSAIRRVVRQIAERFHPDKIILFGSYAYGQPHAESDVDLLVIMPTRNAIDQAIRIDLAFERPFALDLHVRTPYQIKQGLKDGDCDWFLREVMEKGKVLYEAPDCSVGEQSRRRHKRSKDVGHANAASPKRCVLPLPSGSGEVPQAPPPAPRRRRTKNP